VTPPHRRWPRRLARGDDGSALIEFIGLSILLLVPLMYLLVTVFAIQRAAFGVTQAAREAGRAFATAPTAAVGMQRAQVAADLALEDQGLHHGAALGYGSCGGGGSPSLAAGARFTVCVRTTAPLPLTARGPLSGAGSVTVNGTYVVSVDAFRETR